MRDYETLFVNTADLMCELGGSARIVRVNPAFDRFLGTPPTTDSSWVDLFDQQDQAEVTRVLESVAADGPTAVVEGRMLASNVWTNWQLTRLPDERIVAVGRDITEHRMTARALESKSSFLHSIIEAEPECVKLVSQTGELLDMNRAGLSMIGASTRDEAIGQNVYDLMAPEDRERFVTFNERVCQGDGGELSFDIIGLDGTRRSMETTAVPLPSEDGDDLLQLAITRDVTQRHQLEDQLRHAQKMEAVGQLAGGVAHDFNNLLTAIIGPTELALRHVDDDHVIAEDLKQIKATAERAARLTQQLLAFARRQVVQLQNLSLGELVATLEEMLTRVIGEEYQLELAVDPLAHTIRADRGQMEQVVLNLVVNARDAIADGGRIRLSVANEELTDARATRLGCQPGPHVTLSVSDDGIGISPAAMPHLFDPFFTTKPAGTSTGLGLATCYGIITQLGGAIEIDSAEGEGATFTVVVPAVSSKPPAPPDRGPQRRGESEPILIVEDEPVVRRAVARMLASIGYVVHQASDGAEALNMAEEIDHIALLLTDITMPGMSGPTLAKQMLTRRPDLKVLYMTGYLSKTVTEGDPDEQPILKKPFTSSKLSEAVARTLSAAPAARTPS